MKSVRPGEPPKEVRGAYSAIELGMLRAAQDWASITGRVRVDPGNEEHNFLVVVEGDDPVARGATVTMSMAPRTQVIPAGAVRIQ